MSFINFFTQISSHFFPSLFHFLSDNLNCPSGWKEFRCSCYFFAARETVTLHSAEKHCYDKFSGSHLVTTSTKEEINFVGKHINEYRWLGLQKVRKRVQLVGEGKASFQAWDTKRDSQSTTKCIAGKPTRRLNWIARSCSRKFKYICEKRVSTGKKRF